MMDVYHACEDIANVTVEIVTLAWDMIERIYKEKKTKFNLVLKILQKRIRDPERPGPRGARRSSLCWSMVQQSMCTPSSKQWRV